MELKYPLRAHSEPRKYGLILQRNHISYSKYLKLVLNINSTLNLLFKTTNKEINRLRWVAISNTFCKSIFIQVSHISAHCILIFIIKCFSIFFFIFAWFLFLCFLFLFRFCRFSFVLGLLISRYL